jgi:hypothetical protein
MREFYRLRGAFAHGMLHPQQPVVWNPHEHLILATIAFPLLVKEQLARSGRYHLTPEDHVQREVFETFADTTDFLNVPADQQGGLDSTWRQLRQEGQRRVRVAAAIEVHQEIARQRVVEEQAGEIGPVDDDSRF